MSEFADKLIQVMGGSVKNVDEESLQTLHPKNWEKLGEKVQSIINTPPYFSYMLGSLPTGNHLDIFRLKHSLNVCISNTASYRFSINLNTFR